MRDKTLIEFVSLERISETFVSPTKYEFRGSAKHPWLQRVCFWILDRLGAQAVEATVRVEQHRWPVTDLLDAVRKQQSFVLGYHGKAPTRVVMGAEDYAALMRSPLVRDYVDVSICPDSVYGLRLEVVPWMSGVLVLP